MTPREHAETAVAEIQRHPMLALEILVDRFTACRDDIDTLINRLAMASQRGVKQVRPKRRKKNSTVPRA